jgi:hypothetical protein
MNIVKRIFRSSTIKYYSKKISSLGASSKLTVYNFLLSRLFIELLLFILLFFIPKFGIIIALISVILFHNLYPYFLIDSNISIRNNDLYDEALIFFQMLKLSLKSSNDMRKSLEIVALKLNNDFAKDFDKSLKKNKYNNSLLLVFKDMENKTSNQDIIVSLIDLSESNDYDLTLNKIIKNLQQKNKQIIKRKYTQLPFKLTIISITFVFSIILLIIYMPSILSILG